MTSVNSHTNDFALIVWRRKFVVLGTVLLFMVVTALVSQLLPKVYTTSGKLIVVQSSDTQGFDAVQAAQVTARTYSNVLRNRDLATEVARALDGPTSADDILDAISVEPVAETQLIQITAEALSPQRAKAIADAYLRVVERFARTRLASATKTTVVPTGPAPLVSAPSRPRPKLYLFVGALLGLGVGLALALGRDRLDLRVRTLEEIEAAFGAPVVALIPERSRTDPHSDLAFAEAFRSMRTNLVLANSPRGPVGTMAILSEDVGEGKSTCAHEFAAVCATGEMSVILVYADVYRAAEPAAGVVGGPSNIGLTDYLMGDADLPEVMKPTDTPGLSVITCGSRVSSLANLLAVRNSTRSLAEVRDAADLVVVDCPPLKAGADAASVAGHVDGVVVVVDSRAARVTTIRETVRQLEAVDAQIIGVVVNRYKQRDAHVAYAYTQPGPPQASRRGALK